MDHISGPLNYVCVVAKEIFLLSGGGGYMYSDFNAFIETVEYEIRNVTKLVWFYCV